MTYEEALAHIHAMQRFGSRLGLERIDRLLQLAGRPEADLPCIHVAGTNGKGSVTAMVAAIARAAGYRVGMYISPYLEDFRERIQVDGGCIPPREVAYWTEQLLPLVDRLVGEGLEHPTEFEFVTALAFSYFAASRVQVAVLEVGLGGRYDATNVIPAPLACVISGIAFDHTDRLGNTLAAIAYEKAGIVKPKAPVVAGVVPPEALAVIERVAREREAPLYVAGRQFHWSERICSHQGQSIDLVGVRQLYADLGISLLGRHQQGNAACAVLATEVATFPGRTEPGLGEAAVREGLASCRWPGRLEVLAWRPLVVLDAAHNPDGASALCRALPLFPRRRLLMVVGILKDKDAEAMVRLLAPAADLLIATSPAGPRGGSAERIADLARPLSRAVRVEPQVDDALGLALREAGPKDMVLVAGSIYLVGPARATLRAMLGTGGGAPCGGAA